MKKNNVKDYWKYDYISVTVKRKNADDVISSYGAFLWEEVSRSEDKRYHDVIHVDLRRPHAIKQKDRLQLLQVQYESCINKYSLEERRKHSKSQAVLFTACALIISALLGIIATIFYLKSAGAVIGGTILVALQLTLGCAMFLMSTKIRQKENKIFAEKVSDFNSRIAEVLCFAKKALGEEYGKDEKNR